jgi:hypothetical protein
MCSARNARKPARCGVTGNHPFADGFIERFVYGLNLGTHLFRIFFFDCLARSFDKSAQLRFGFRISRSAINALPMPFHC